MIDKFTSLKYRQLLLKRHLVTMEAKSTFSTFIQYLDSNYQLKWFHKLIADKCQAVFDGKIKRLMIFLPPQHGKSQITSRFFPAWYLGNRPETKLVIASYSGDLSASFCRDSQRILESEVYTDIFGQVIGGKGLVKNSEYFETEGGGFYKSVGVGGSLIGRRGDLAIIDDPVKDAMEAYSETSRSRVWEWYTNVLETRLHNDSATILIMTRWHEDDLAGRLLDAEREKWDIINIPAIYEGIENEYDHRRVGEALWPERHNVEKLERLRSLSPRTFAALYQQSPVSLGGNIVKTEWFGKISPRDFLIIRHKEPIIFFADTAYDEKNKKTDNDPTGIIATCRVDKTLYITAGKKVFMQFPDLCRFIPEFAHQNGYDASSSVRIEPKANGTSVVQQLKSQTGLNVVKTESPTDSKETRLTAASPIIEAGRVVLVIGAWTDEFIDEVCGFPNKVHDEYVDVLCYAINYHKMGTTNRKNPSGIFY